MEKSLFDLAIEYTGHDKNNLTEFQENEIDALVKFGQRVLENAAQQRVQPTLLIVCPKCGGWLKGGECENCTLP